MGGLLREGERVKFAFIAAEKATWPVTWMCRKLGVSRSGFYAYQGRRKSPRAVEDGRLRVLVAVAHETGRRTYGSPRIHRELRDVHGVRRPQPADAPDADRRNSRGLHAAAACLHDGQSTRFPGSSQSPNARLQRRSTESPLGR